MKFEINNFITYGRSQCTNSYEFGGLRNYYVIHFILKGKGEYQVDKKKWSLGKNDAFLIRPNEQHLYKADELDPWEYMWICFSGDISSMLYRLKINSDNLCTHISDMDYINELFNHLKEPTIYQKPDILLSNIGYVHLILSQFVYEDSKMIEGRLKSDKIVKNHVFGMQCYIEINYMNPITVSDVINYIQLDRSYASHLYKKEKNISIFEDIQNRRIQKAVELLSSNYTIKEITYMCGFKNYQNFLSTFKSRFNIIPGEYRNRLLSKKY